MKNAKANLDIFPEATRNLIESCESGRVLLQTGYLKLRQDTVRLPDGKQATREYLVHPGAVMIVPCFDDGEVLLLRQYRHPLRQVFIEFPAGKIDANEMPLNTAKRELLEETGYQAARWSKLTTIHNAIAYSTEAIHLYLAQGLTAGTAQPDEGEFVEPFKAPLSVLMTAISQGQITDVKTIIGAFFLKERMGV